MDLFNQFIPEVDNIRLKRTQSLCYGVLYLLFFNICKKKIKDISAILLHIKSFMAPKQMFRTNTP